MYQRGNDLMYLGLQIDSIDIRSPTKSETDADPFYSYHNHISNDKCIKMSKLLDMQQVHIYCSREKEFVPNRNNNNNNNNNDNNNDNNSNDDNNNNNDDDNDINSSSSSSSSNDNNNTHKSGILHKQENMDTTMVSPFDISLKLMIAYQKTAQVFGPVLVDFKLTPITVHLSDEQV